MAWIRDLKAYLPFTLNTFKRYISYKGNVLIFMFGQILMLSVTYYLWKAIFGSSTNTVINGFNFNEMIIYIFISFLTSLFISIDISYDIASEVKDGSIAINLLRPISFEKRMFFQGLGTVLFNFILVFIWAFIALTIFLYKANGYINIGNIIYYFISIFLALGINFYFSYTFGLLSFKLTNMWGLSQIVQAIVQLLSGMLVPIGFFPKWAQGIVSLLPFSSAIYTPSMIYLNKISGIDILKALGLQVFWIIVFMLVAKSMWKSLIKSLTILGG